MCTGKTLCTEMLEAVISGLQPCFLFSSLCLFSTFICVFLNFHTQKCLPLSGSHSRPWTKSCLSRRFSHVNLTPRTPFPVTTELLPSLTLQSDPPTACRIFTRPWNSTCPSPRPRPGSRRGQGRGGGSVDLGDPVCEGAWSLRDKDEK